MHIVRIFGYNTKGQAGLSKQQGGNVARKSNYSQRLRKRARWADASQDHRHQVRRAARLDFLELLTIITTPTIAVFSVGRPEFIRVFTLISSQEISEDHSSSIELPAFRIDETPDSAPSAIADSISAPMGTTRPQQPVIPPLKDDYESPSIT